MVTPDLATAEERRRTPAGNALEGRYHSLFAIGRGGMGRVEVALDRGPEGSGRVVALKRLLPESARDPRRKEMFVREATIAALLTHPNVVHAFAYGEIYDELFLAMEYVEGESLSRVLAAAREQGQALDPALAALILAHVCEGLHAAHELRDESGEPLHLVHRDVSPHNVMIAYDGHVKILDFGVAKFEAASQHTRTGEVKGKMAYMSPEQALGDNLDRRSDLFSVGAVLFECVAGRRMWGGETDMEVMRSLALQAPPRLDEVAPGAPAALVMLQARLTARDLAARPATALEVATELRAFAVAANPGGDVAAVGVFMDRLFRREAEVRRARLAEALDHLPASGASGGSDVGRSLECDLDEPCSVGTQPVIVVSPRPVASRSRARWATLVSLAVALGVCAATLATWRHHASARAPVQTKAEEPVRPMSAAPAIPAGAAVGRTVEPLVGPRVGTRAPVRVEPEAEGNVGNVGNVGTGTVPPPAETSLATAASRAVPTAGFGKTGSAPVPLPPRPPAPKPPAPAPPHLPDVDPTPF